ncbi:MAG: hypothetical protein JWM32_216 [Verrucomicrobia bacterium]|nr:hypothetical protein [Verrucomicrobiota bacterium]
MKVISQKPRTVRGAESWRLASDRVEAFLTCEGGHLAPVTFQTDRGPVQPFHVAPWTEKAEAKKYSGPLKVLRGDFFCAPFGGNERKWRQEQHTIHGETSGKRWKLRAIVAVPGGIELSAEMRTSVRRGLVTKRIQLRDGETNLYCQHELAGFTGPMCLGHHATLAFPPEEGSGQITISSWRQGRVCPSVLEDPARGGYSCLQPDAPFQDLRRVPRSDGSMADLSRYPARAGFEDAVMVSAAPGAGPAWTAVSFPKSGYLWFALKDSRVLASTLLWISNGGRHYSPWNGRHRAVMGLEEVTSYFHYGLAESAASNPRSRRGIPTVLQLHPSRPLKVNYVMGVVAIPRRFDRVRGVRFGAGQVVFESESGASVVHAVDLDFLAAGRSRPGVRSAKS